MPKPSHAELTQQYQATLDAFVLRARRVVQHSLAADPKALLALASGRMTLEFDHVTGKKFLTHNLPEEEVVESAAARVRPILLNSEPVHWGRALKALSFLCQGKAGLDEDAIPELREVWKRVQPTDGTSRAYVIWLQKEHEEVPSTATDSALGLAWFYGDVVHADTDRRAEGAAFGINERYRAAVMLVAIAMVSTQMTLNLILKLRQQGILEVPEATFAEDVVVTDFQVRRETEVYVADAGTPMPAGPLHGIPDGFEPFHPDRI